ncbi:hypothetical protein [Actinacidiphila acidipaludis]|uniref:Uncharacterized protein n=1 Tax=Actinacidiphila acidipaludis TaxID=2873382 RepID=A0ABS7QI17_9ACTN|nr:hypothetical protein [Streptomyces acidipaludis]MBY8882817.1 hypothetical protein [Streptomyces acidipaludis]
MAEATAPTSAHDPWRDAHDTARAVREALQQLGIPETVLTPLTARQDATGAHRVVIPPLPLADAARLLTALGPALGPHGAHLSRPGPAL